MSVSDDGSVCSPESTIWAKAILLSPGMALRRRHINKDVLLPFWNSKHLALAIFFDSTYCTEQYISKYRFPHR